MGWPAVRYAARTHDRAAERRADQAAQARPVEEGERDQREADVADGGEARVDPDDRWEGGGVAARAAQAVHGDRRRGDPGDRGGDVRAVRDVRRWAALRAPRADPVD